MVRKYNKKMEIAAGVDIGGSHITTALIDLNTRTIVDSTWKRRNIDPNKNSEIILESWAAIIKESFKAVSIEPSKIGIAMPGPFDYINGISYIWDQNKYDALYGINIKEKLAEKLMIPADNIVIVNDAACFLKGEIFSGAGKGLGRIMAITLGTGLGSARFFNGKTEDADLWKSEYKDGIAEDYLSTRWFLKRYHEISDKAAEDVKELVYRINQNSLAQKVFDEFGNNLADFLIPFIKKEQLQLIILGGNISLASKYFFRTFEETFKREHINIEISISKLGENAALIGAASSHYFSSTLPVPNTSEIFKIQQQ